MDHHLLAGRYRLLEPLGHGGMGQVRRAWDSSLGRAVAVKLLELNQADPAAAERFRREARTTARLTHPTVALTAGPATSKAEPASGLVRAEPASGLVRAEPASGLVRAEPASGLVRASG